MERSEDTLAKSRATGTNAAAAQKPAASKPAPSFADVARRTASRTTDLIAMAIVLVGSLTLGRQVLQWWQADPPPANAVGEAGSAPTWESGGPLVLEFGDLPLAITRQAIRGDREAAIDALVARCWEEAGRGEVPAGKPDEAEQRLLARIADLTPVTEEPGRRQVYLIDERFPMVGAVGPGAEVGTDVAEVVRLRKSEHPTGPDSHESGYDRAGASSPPRGKGAGGEDGTSRDAPPSPPTPLPPRERGEQIPKATPVQRMLSDRGSAPIDPAGPKARLLCWGMAMPIGNSAWTLFVFRHSAAKRLPGSEIPDVPLPPGARRNLSLRDIHGGGLIGFSVSGTADTLMKFYDDWFQKQGWVATQEWQSGERVWTVRYRERPGSDAALADVRLAEDREGLLAGLIQIVPPAPSRDADGEKRGSE